MRSRLDFKSGNHTGQLAFLLNCPSIHPEPLNQEILTSVPMLDVKIQVYVYFYQVVMLGLYLECS